MVKIPHGNVGQRDIVNALQEFHVACQLGDLEKAAEAEAVVKFLLSEYVQHHYSAVHKVELIQLEETSND